MAEPGDRHADHDPLLIAALLDTDLAATERVAAQSRIATCPECAALHADLVALSTATAALPAPARPRDFRLHAAGGRQMPLA